MTVRGDADQRHFRAAHLAVLLTADGMVAGRSDVGAEKKSVAAVSSLMISNLPRDGSVVGPR